jgi:hypothetical protein
MFGTAVREPWKNADRNRSYEYHGVDQLDQTLTLAPIPQYSTRILHVNFAEECPQVDSWSLFLCG